MLSVLVYCLWNTQERTHASILCKHKKRNAITHTHMCTQTSTAAQTKTPHNNTHIPNTRKHINRHTNTTPERNYAELCAHAQTPHHTPVHTHKHTQTHTHTRTHRCPMLQKNTVKKREKKNSQSVDLEGGVERDRVTQGKTQSTRKWGCERERDCCCILNGFNTWRQKST